MPERYAIQLSGLQEGHNFFDFAVDTSFFDLFEESEVKEGCLTASVDILKRKSFYELTLSIEGTVNVVCDRCLDSFAMPIKTQKLLIIKQGFNNVEDEEDDDIIVLQGQKTLLDLKQYIYDFIIISLPLQRVHPDDANGDSGCNHDMLSKLSEYIINE